MYPLYLLTQSCVAYVRDVKPKTLSTDNINRYIFLSNKKKFEFKIVTTAEDGDTAGKNAGHTY